MTDSDFQKAYEEQNERDYITNATIATVIQIPLNLFCSIMDFFAVQQTQQKWSYLFLARVVSVLAVALAWAWYKMQPKPSHRHLGYVWIMSPLLMILWMVWYVRTPGAPYYAGLNIIMLGMGLLTPWAYVQNLLVTLFVVVMYVAVSALATTPQPMHAISNNMTFLILTGVIVVSGSVASARQRFREFSLRWELDKSRRVVEESNRKLVELDRVKNQFFANISHELRTPLTLLLAPLQRLQIRCATSSDTESRDLLETMDANGMRLLKLINDLLDLVRLESGRMEVKREPLDVRAFVSGLSSALRQVADEKGIRLRTSTEGDIQSVLADRDKLEKIILNLAFNALKFTPTGGRVEITVSRQDKELVLNVSDTGVGISEKNLPFIFDRFWQADMSSNRKYQGVGIGLALVKELVELQGGQVQAQSKEGHGTTFRVRFPYIPVDSMGLEGLPAADRLSGSQGESSEKSDEWLANLYRRAELFPAMSRITPTKAPSEWGARRDGARVLIADDEPDMRRFLKSQLNREYQVFEAADGLEAIAQAAALVPEMILLDMMMPGKDGREVCQELRALPGTRKIPIILLTAKADESTKLAVLEAGASDFLSKPFSTTELHVRIRNLVDSYRYQQRLAEQNEVLQRTIDQLKATESQLVESEKMRSLGQLSAGLIHEINNPLNFAITGLFTLRNSAKLLPDDRRGGYVEMLDDVEEGIKRVKDLVSKMREFSYAENTRVEQVEVAQVVASALRFLSHEWKERVRVEQRITAGQCLWANRNRMTQVLLNILQNSLDALARKTFLGEEQPTICIETRAEPERVLLMIRDNGAGIQPKNLDRVFDPFFTTKEVGQGMGLGLSICYRIVRDYSGRISVRSEPGKFCEFGLEFPVERPAESGPQLETGDQYARAT